MSSEVFFNRESFEKPCLIAYVIFLPTILVWLIAEFFFASDTAVLLSLVVFLVCAIAPGRAYNRELGSVMPISLAAQISIAFMALWTILVVLLTLYLIHIHGGLAPDLPCFASLIILMAGVLCFLSLRAASGISSAPRA